LVGVEAVFSPDSAFSHGVVSIVICHGQKYSAVMVNVVSRELENVLVEQNHSQGLNRAIRSWKV
jgi:hypothetical protein